MRQKEERRTPREHGIGDSLLGRGQFTSPQRVSSNCNFLDGSHDGWLIRATENL